MVTSNNPRAVPYPLCGTAFFITDYCISLDNLLHVLRFIIEPEQL